MPLPSKELGRQFRAAAWNTPQDMDAFAADAHPVPPADLVGMLGVLIDRKASQEGRSHALRVAVFHKLAAAATARELFVPMCRAMPRAEVRLRQALTELLPMCNNVAEQHELVALFRHHLQGVRASAAEVFKKIAGKTAFGLLIEQCGKPEFVGRIEALDALVSLGQYQAIPGLQAVLAVGTSDEKQVALRYLSNKESMAKNIESALEAIATSLKDNDDKVAITAIQSYARLADEDLFIDIVGPGLESGNLVVVRAIVFSMRAYSSSRALTLLRKQFRLGPRSVRLAVLDTLEAIGTEDILPIIAEALDNRQINIRMKAAEVLQNLAVKGQVDLARTILWLLRSRDVNVKRIAADIALKVGDPHGRIWPQLLRFLRDEDWWVRERITDALVDMAGVQLTRHVVGLLEDESDVVRRYAVDMLMRLEDAESLGALLRTATTDTDWWVRERAIEAIGRLKDARAIPYIVDIMSKDADVVFVAIESLGIIGDPSSVPYIVPYLQSLDVDILLTALAALRSIDDPSAAESIHRLSAHPDHRVRRVCYDVLQRWHATDLEGFESDGAKRELSTLDRLLYAMAKANSDDLLIAAERKPYIKRLGEMRPLANNVFTNEQVEGLVLPLLTDEQRNALERLEDVDFSYEVISEGLRFRANIFRAQTGLSAVFRIVKQQIPELSQLGLPAIVGRFGDLKNGLVLIGGPTGSGKSTTLAAIIDYINRKHRKHIITLEDPIEVVHKPRTSLVNQREIGTHTYSFHAALRATLREDPDVILVGEMRDLETISFAITAAETGHLVFGTVHTTTADTSIDRLLNAFPGNEQPQVRSILSNSLRAVCCQMLIPTVDTKGRVPAVEIMLNNDAVANLIRSGKTFQIPMVVATARNAGMQSMDNELLRLTRAGAISPEVAYMKAINKKEFESILEDQTEGSQSVLPSVEGADGGADKIAPMT